MRALDSIAMDEVQGARSPIPVLWRLSAPALQPYPTTEVCGNAVAREAQSTEQLYPPPMILHDDILFDKELFYDSLFKFHAAFGSEMRMPKIRGKDFNLHGLYCKVIEQGGLLKVVKENKWKRIAEALDLPACVTCPSFFLRQNYVTLLHHFEQVHFWGAQGRPVPPPVPLPQPLEAPALVPQVEASEAPIPKKRGREKFDQVLAGKANPLVPLGRNVTGVIDGKFEHGYLVTVVVGSEKLKGVIYHVHPDQINTKQFAEVEKPLKSSDLRRSLQSARRQTKVTKETPPRPATSTGYKFFATEQKNTGAKGRIIRERWNALTAEEKKPYLEMSDRDEEQGEALETAQQDDEEGAELCNADPSSRFKLFQPSSYFSMQSLLDQHLGGFTSFTSQLEQLQGFQHQGVYANQRV